MVHIVHFSQLAVKLRHSRLIHRTGLRIVATLHIYMRRVRILAPVQAIVVGLEIQCRMGLLFLRTGYQTDQWRDGVFDLPRWSDIVCSML
jgi:hypothetical protein